MEIYRINNRVPGDTTLIDSVDRENRPEADFSGSVTSGDDVLVVKSHGHAGAAGQYMISGHFPKPSIEHPSVPEISRTNPFVIWLLDPTDRSRLTRWMKEEVVLINSTQLHSSRMQN